MWDVCFCFRPAAAGGDLPPFWSPSRSPVLCREEGGALNPLLPPFISPLALLLPALYHLPPPPLSTLGASVAGLSLPPPFFPFSIPPQPFTVPHPCPEGAGPQSSCHHLSLPAHKPPPSSPSNLVISPDSILTWVALLVLYPTIQVCQFLLFLVVSSCTFGSCSPGFFPSRPRRCE